MKKCSLSIFRDLSSLNISCCKSATRAGQKLGLGLGLGLRVRARARNSYLLT